MDRRSVGMYVNIVSIDHEPLARLNSELFDDRCETQVVIKYYDYDDIDVKQMM